MKISVSGLSKNDPIFGSDKFLKLRRARNKFIVEVKEHLNALDKISRFFSNLFGTECRNIAEVLNSPEGQARLKQVGNKEVRSHLNEINKKIENLNKQLLVRTIALINIPEFSGTPSPVNPSGSSGTSPRRSSYINDLLVPFYQGSGQNVNKRTLDMIWNLSLENKEAFHNYIQWLFPLPIPSRFNKTAPVLNSQLIADLKATPGFKDNLKKSLEVMLEFYGLEWNNSEIKMSAHFEERAKVWLFSKNKHNYDRLSRILQCLLIFNLNAENKALFACLSEIKVLHPQEISENSWNFWEKATISVS